MTKNWAVCIGVNQYNNLPRLKYAKRDAELMRDYFYNEAEFEKVYLFTDDSPPITDAGNPFSSQPTYGSLKRFLRVRFNQPFLSRGDNLWFFFSGHGLRHADRDYLMSSDADPHPEGVEDTAISMNYVTERLRRCGADNVVLIYDACRNEQSSKGLGVGEEKQKGVITIASCSPSERSYEIEQIQQGSFTYALVESLRIQGENNCATVERLYQRLCYRVTEINQQFDKPRQTPYVIAEPATKYHLILLSSQATLQDIATLKLDAQEAELEGQDGLAEQLWTRILTVLPAEPQALMALRRIWSKPKSSPPQPKPITTSSGERSSTPTPLTEPTPSPQPVSKPDIELKSTKGVSRLNVVQGRLTEKDSRISQVEQLLEQERQQGSKKQGNFHFSFPFRLSWGVGLGLGVAIALPFIVYYISTNYPHPVMLCSSANGSDVPRPSFLVSKETKVDYTPLCNLLRAQKWEEADKETRRMILQVTGSRDNFPCEDLRIIDQLWLIESRGKFGFSVQKKIYQLEGGSSNWRNFTDAVGWSNREKERLEYWELEKTNLSAAPYGHLPVWVHYQNTGIAKIGDLAPRLFSRMTVCHL